MKRRSVLIAVAVVVLALIAGAGGFVVWSNAQTAREQRAIAERVAASLAAGTIDAADFLQTAGVDPVDAHRTIVRGMGGLKPAVAVAGVAGRDAQYADATLRYTWTPIADKQPWSYDVTLPLQKTPEGWRASWSPEDVAPGLREGERLLYNRLRPTRGAILGAGGAKLASNQPARRVGLDKAQLDPTSLDAAARALAAALTAHGVRVDPDAYAKKVAAAGAKAFVEAALLRANLPAQAAAAEAVRPLPGVSVQDVTQPLGITATFLRPILGQVAEASADAVAASGGELVAGDLVGTGGLQASRDRLLRGQAGYVIQAVQTQGAQARDLQRVVAVDGGDVQTTIDLRLQTIAEGVLAGVAPASALVAIRPSDGALLAVASGPGSAGVASTATQALYEPGSTFKTVSGLAMLRHGLTPTSTLACPDSIVVDGYTFHNDQGYPAGALGSIPWTTAFAHSCNTAVIGQAQTVTQADLRSAADALGLTLAPSLGVPVTASRVPDTASGATEHAASMIGQGKVLTTPLGMATVTASIAKGALVTPTLLLGDAASAGAAAAPGSASASASPAAPGDPSAPAAPASTPGAGVPPLTAQEAAQLRTLMRGVVTEGTAQSALAGTPGGEIMAKTGTSTYVVNGQQRYHTWLIAIQGDLAVAVMVADGDYGAGTCGPLLKSFLTQRAAG